MSEVTLSPDARPHAPSDSLLTVSVIVPTYRRTDLLANCLDALAAQTLKPDEVIVVMRIGDEATEALLEMHSESLRVVRVERPGQVHAMNSAVRVATGEIVAFTDDDAEPAEDWLERLIVHYRDPLVGGVGGKVHVPDLTDRLSSANLRVGSVSTLGRPLGNHHLADGPARPVQWLKGVNMSYRRSLCWFDESLRGPGAQVSNDAEVGLRLGRAGWRVVYEPAARVNHFAGPRHDGDGRRDQTDQAVFDAAFNETFALLRHLRGGERVRCFLFLLLVGVPRARGPLGVLKAMASRGDGRSLMHNCSIATRARLVALADAIREPRSRAVMPAPSGHR